MATMDLFGVRRNPFRREAAFNWAAHVLGDRCALLVLDEISTGSHDLVPWTDCQRQEHR
jgi:hypothetical protein